MTLTEALRTVAQLADLEVADLEWIASRCTVHEASDGERLFLHGDPADVMIFLLEGGYEARVPDSETVFTSRAPEVTGYLPYSRMLHWTATAVAVGAVRYATFPKDALGELIYRVPTLGQRLVAAVIDRSREATRSDLQREKLASLGQLSAGLAHELNNPAASAKRDAEAMQDTLARLSDAEARLAHAATNALHAQVSDLERAILERSPVARSPLERSDLEATMSDWLEARGVERGYALAPGLVDAGATVADLEGLADFEPIVLAAAVERVAARVELQGLAAGIRASVARISDLVRAIKAYSYMDSAGEADVDVNAGLSSTLTMLAHKLKGLKLETHLEATLPAVHGYGGQLNQVWTNLIDNAADALESHPGTLRITTRSADGFVFVTVGDDGPGIPMEVQQRLFEPFYTTKPQGKGTGLGLSTARQIVRAHRGEIRLESQPGDTRFTVRLPVARG